MYLDRLEVVKKTYKDLELDYLSIVECVFDECVFEDVKASDSYISDNHFIECTFKNVDFGVNHTEYKTDSSFTRCTFIDCVVDAIEDLDAVHCTFINTKCDADSNFNEVI